MKVFPVRVHKRVTSPGASPSVTVWSHLVIQHWCQMRKCVVH